MAEKNGYNSGDFKRNADQGDEDNFDQDGGEDASKFNEKAGEYMRELLSEKIKLSNGKFSISCKLIDQEVTRVQSSGRTPSKDFKYVDVFREKPTKVVVKVLVPVKEYPKFNFVGKILGPKGNTMKSLQEETMCKMAVLGRGSMRDRQKEEELRNSLDPKYAHLSDELHVEISALAPPAEAHARIAYALAEVKKYLLPDNVDVARQSHMRDIMDRGAHPPVGHSRGPSRHPPAPPPMPRLPNKSKVISILDRARSAMEAPYYDMEHYPEPLPVHRPPARVAPEVDFYYDRSERFYEEDMNYYKDDGQRDYKSSREVGTRRQPVPPLATSRQYSRPQPYQRQPHKPMVGGTKKRAF